MILGLIFSVKSGLRYVYRRARLCSPSPRVESTGNQMRGMREVIIWKGFTKTTYLVNQVTGERTEVGTGIGASSAASAARPLGGTSPARGRRRTPPKQRGARRKPPPGQGASAKNQKKDGAGRAEVVELTERAVAETAAMKEALAGVQQAIDAMVATAQAEGLTLELGLQGGVVSAVASAETGEGEAATPAAQPSRR